jgi:hypothetical protein
MRYKEFKILQQLDELRMNPTSFQKFINSPDAQNIVAGFEAELCFINDNDESPDYSLDKEAYSIQTVTDFFSSNRANDWDIILKVSDKLSNEFSDWYDQKYQKVLDDWEADADVLIELWLHNNNDIEDAEIYQLANMKMDPDTSLMTAIEQAAINIIKSKDKLYDEIKEEWVHREIRWKLGQSEWIEQRPNNMMSEIQKEFNLAWPFTTRNRGGYDLAVSQRLADDLERTFGFIRNIKVAERVEDDTVWKFVSDGSVHGDDQFDNIVEIVSPPMPITDLLKFLPEFFKWVKKNGGYANSTAGFHMSVSIAGVDPGTIDFIKLALFLGDEYVLDQFQRAGSGWCNSAVEALKEKIVNKNTSPDAKISTTIKAMQDGLISIATKTLLGNNKGFGKYISINPKDKYIEFRSAGGEDYDNNVPKLTNTLIRYAQAMYVASRPDLEQREYAKKLYKLISPAKQDPILELFSQYSTGQLSAEELKYKWSQLILSADEDSFPEHEWAAVDVNTGEVLLTTKNFSRFNAFNYFRNNINSGYNFSIRQIPTNKTKGKLATAQKIQRKSSGKYTKPEFWDIVVDGEKIYSFAERGGYSQAEADAHANKWLSQQGPRIRNLINIATSVDVVGRK